jgi:hypothetical protein
MRVAELPLHDGKAPRWLFERMVRLGSEICELFVEHHGKAEFVRRLADPYWFQAISCVLGFDWHSSGTTTTTTAALRIALEKKELGIAIAGGKHAMRKTPLLEVKRKAVGLGLNEKDANALSSITKLSFKTDEVLLQDGFNLYHHAVCFDENGRWSIIHQGMNLKQGLARRYQWLDEEFRSVTQDPQHAVCCELEQPAVLNLSSSASEEARRTMLDLLKEKPSRIKRLASLLDTKQHTLLSWECERSVKTVYLKMPAHINWHALETTYEMQPERFEQILGIPGLGKQTLKALALIAQLIFGSEADWRDPVKYSFAVGGKDGVPFPVNRQAMDECTTTLQEIIKDAKLHNAEKLRALQRLACFSANTEKNHVKVL